VLVIAHAQVNTNQCVEQAHPRRPGRTGTAADGNWTQFQSVDIAVTFVQQKQTKTAISRRKTKEMEFKYAFKAAGRADTKAVQGRNEQRNNMIRAGFGLKAPICLAI
jgi:hypothetical protein